MHNTKGRPIRADSIPVVLPDAVENEEELDKDAAKGKYPTHYYTGDRLCEERLFRNLPGDLICSHWLLDSLRRSRKEKRKDDFFIM